MTTPDLAEAVRRACSTGWKSKTYKCRYPDCACVQAADVLTTLLATARAEGAKAEREEIAAWAEGTVEKHGWMVSRWMEGRQIGAAIRARGAAKEEK